MSYQLVWFKRDLRLHDHAPLHTAAAKGPVACLYIIEPALWAQPDYSAMQYGFLIESLRELHASLKALGSTLYILTGNPCEILDQIYKQAPFEALYSHEETGNSYTFQRDKRVAAWCKENKLKWHEFRQFGVVRRLKNRNDWKDAWDLHTSQPCLPTPSLTNIKLNLPPPQVPLVDTMTIDRHQAPRRHKGGRSEGLAVLNSFIDARSQKYRGGISSPLSAPTACSRVSAYLAFGCISLREVVKATQLKLLQLPLHETRQRLGLNAFVSRLYWHCHFIQKLESEPAIEHQNMHRGYNGFREKDFNQAHFDALINARTGWPLVDACVTMLNQTGWLNFRMRAMLVSTAAYTLFLHWRPVGEWLARQFLDYEPGIHWSQMQMQSGTTGINTPRVYNPVKQARDHDPDGQFVRQWLPYLRNVPGSWIFEPWRMPANIQKNCGVFVGQDIPVPIVDLDSATREAKAKLFALRAKKSVKAGKADIVEKHGSRKLSNTSAGKTINKTVRQKTTKNANQLGFDF